MKSRFVVTIDNEALLEIAFNALGVEPHRVKTVGDAAQVLEIFLKEKLTEYTGEELEDGEVRVTPAPKS